MLRALRTTQVFVVRERSEVIATFRLSATKPWAIDLAYFTPVDRPLYLLAMAVSPTRQREGIGTQVFEEAKRLAREWGADAIRLDAYDAAAGAGQFYARCGCVERGRVSYRRAPLIYFEVLLG